MPRPHHSPAGSIRAPQPHTPRRTPPPTGLTYSGKGHKSLHEKAGGWGKLVGFLYQDIKAHLGKRKQKKRMVLQPPVGGRGRWGGEGQEVRGAVCPLRFHPQTPGCGTPVWLFKALLPHHSS